MNSAASMVADPAAEMMTIEVTGRAMGPDGVRVLDPGKHTLPAEWARKLIAAGLAIGETSRRVVALGGIMVGGRVLERGEVAEIVGAVPEYITRTGRLIELAPGEEPPAPLPVDPGDRLWWTHGPPVAVESPAGERLRLREAEAIEREVYGTARLLGELTPAGREFREALGRWRSSGAVERPDYREAARRHHRAAEQAAAAAAQAELGREIEVRVIARTSVEVNGVLRRPGEEFKVAESLAAGPFLDGRLEAIGRPSPRWNHYVEAIRQYRAAARSWPDADHKFPAY